MSSLPPARVCWCGWPVVPAPLIWPPPDEKAVLMGEPVAKSAMAAAIMTPAPVATWARKALRLLASLTSICWSGRDMSPK